MLWNALTIVAIVLSLAALFTIYEHSRHLAAHDEHLKIHESRLDVHGKSLYGEDVYED
jgi:hypothetical protein